jgi:Kef-type K+ transport system membrane component KefB
VAFFEKENSMSRNTWWGKTLRFIGILLMGITALFTIAGGLGTTCVALNPTGFGESMALLAPFQWLYIVFVVATTAIGVMAARAVFLLAKSRPNSYRYAITALVLGVVVGVIHIVVSRSLRGKSMPVDGVVYTTVLTLIVLLLFPIPRIWQGVDYTSGNSDDKTGKLAAAITLLVTGILSLTVQFWAGPSHTWDGTNWAAAFHLTSTLLGIGLCLGGAGLLILPEKAPQTASRHIVQN